MIEAIRSLGEYALREQGIELEDAEDITKILIENPASNDTYKKVLKIGLGDNGDGFNYLGIEIDDYDSGQIDKYLYRKGSPNGTDYSPTSRITDPKRTFEIKTLRWYQKEYPEAGLNEDEKMLFYNIRKTLESSQEKIIEDVDAVYKEVKKDKQNAILTVEILTDKERLPGEIEAFKKIFLAEATSNYYVKYNTISKANNNVCSVCGKDNTDVYGFVSTYAFYTVDKPGMVTGGFNQSDAWKNYPVCRECALVLEQGKQWLEKYANFNFYGFDYLMIPYPLIDKVEDEVYEVLRDYHDRGRQVRVSGTYESLLDATQDEVLGLLSEKQNTFHCNMLIYNASKSEFKILRYIEGVYPTDLKRLFDAKKKVDASKYIGKTLIPVWEKRKKIGERPLTFDFGCFWYFLKEDNQSKYFLTLVNDVFKNRTISRQFILGRIMQQIRRSHAVGFIEEPTMKGFCCLLYLDNLGLLGKGESKSMSKEVKEIFPSVGTTRISTAEKIFAEYPGFFKGDPEKAAFIVGVLSQLLMDIQLRTRGATPFRAKLQGLKLDEKKVKALLPEIQNKLEEYESNYYRDLEALASEYFIRAQDRWDLSRDEVSFYFVLGMNLSKYFKSEKEEERDE